MGRDPEFLERTVGVRNQSRHSSPSKLSYLVIPKRVVKCRILLSIVRAVKEIVFCGREPVRATECGY